MYENICNTDLPVFVRREDIQAMKGLPKDFKNRCVFGNKIETNLLRHRDAFQLKDICARSLCPIPGLRVSTKAYF